MSEVRGSWGSKLGFILAASGSAIGLGNIVFFSSNAYKYGGGAFYVPYLVALFLIGIPVMILELGAGRFTRRSMPNALYQIAGKRAEVAGWFGALNASIITMYYIAILAWISPPTYRSNSAESLPRSSYPPSLPSRACSRPEQSIPDASAVKNSI